MKPFYALLIAALLATAACGKKKEQAAKTDPKADPAAKTAEPAKEAPGTPAMPDPAKGEPAKAASGAVTVDQAGAKANEVTDKVVKASADAGDDCSKFGTGLKALMEDAKAMVASDRELAKDPEKKQEYEAKYVRPAQAKLGSLMEKLEKCNGNPDVKRFLDLVGSSE
ncbi:MAG TPA: hypothetical protein VNO30_42895 [Kofleriaceae bacterium]|nr:hypothetical protein [Kofleriaceae bacterium]